MSADPAQASPHRAWRSRGVRLSLAWALSTAVFASPAAAGAASTTQPAFLGAVPTAEPTPFVPAVTPQLGLAQGESPTLPPNVGGWPSVPSTTAASLVVIDRDSGTVLAARDADQLRSVASTVKMLTAVTARRLEQNLDRLLVAGAEVRGLEGSGVGLGEGEAWTVRQLLEAMLVRSGNDAAEALAAQLVPGGTEMFLDEMRADAERMGLDGAVLVSPSGLDDRNQLSASHLAIIGLELLEDEVLREIVGLDATRLPGLGAVPNRNELVRRDGSVIGLKTGFTDAAGHSLVAAADRDGRVTIVVVLDAASADARFEDAARLLDHAASFASLPALEPVELGCPGRRVRLVPDATSVVVPLEIADLVEVSWPPRTCPDRDTIIVTPTLQRLPLVPVTVEVETTEVAVDVTGDAALGQWLAQLVQDAMRALPPGELLGVVSSPTEVDL